MHKEQISFHAAAQQFKIDRKRLCEWAENYLEYKAIPKHVTRIAALNHR
jgi:hypothetical protein